MRSFRARWSRRRNQFMGVGDRAGETAIVRSGVTDACSLVMPTHLALAAWCNLDDDRGLSERRSGFVWIAGVATAVLLAVMSLGGLAWPHAYASETASWRAQAIAQDWFDLVGAAPVLAIAALRARTGSRAARLVQAGVLLYVLYTAAIYAFAVHLNPLFLIYCAALGLSAFGLIALAPLRAELTRRWFDARVPNRLVGGLLVGVGAMFGLLWLAQLAPAVLGGPPPVGLTETGLVTNPIHVLDLSFILPLHVIAGVLLWRRHDLGYALGPVLLAFGAMMAASIGFMTAWTAADGWPVVVAMTALTAIDLMLLVRVIRSLRG
jgi:hypothetical protein